MRSNPRSRLIPQITLPGLVDPHDLRLDRQFSMNLARGMEVLRAFTAADTILGNRELSDRTGLPKATVSRLTYTLTLLGYLSRDSSSLKYQLGPGVLSLGYPLLASMHVRQVARPLMMELARNMGCTVNLGVRDRDHAVYVESVREGGNSLRPDIGNTVPLIATSIGRALIMACAPDERSAIVNYLKVHDPALFKQYLAAWESDKKQFVERGYCIARGDWKKNAFSIAMPVRVPARETRLAMSCTLISDKSQTRKLEREILPHLSDIVKKLEASLIAG